MTDALGIPAGSLRAVWVFAIDLPEAEVDAFRAETYPESDEDPVDWPLRDALGLERLDHDFIEVFQAEKLKEYGFARYLTEANGMDEASVAPDAEMLDALTGQVLLVFTQALPDAVTRLDPRPPLRLIGRYAESLDFTPRGAPESAAAQPVQGDETAPPEAPRRKRPSNAAMMGRVAMVALLVLFALVALMIWIAG